MKYEIEAIRKWSEAGNATSAEVTLEMLAALDSVRLERDQWKETFERSCDDVKDLRAKLDLAKPLLDERYLLLKFIESRDLLFDAHEYISKIRGDK